MRFVFAPMSRPRHPLARVALALLGIAVFGALLVFGLLALGVLIAVGSVLMLVRAWRTRHGTQPGAAAPGSKKRSDNSDVIEGEYVVVHERRRITHR
jgi:hypothetical protein